MYAIDMSGKHALVMGVANHRSLAWAIAQHLHQAGASVCLTYAGERQKDAVEKLAALLEGALVLECDVTKDQEIDAVARKLGKDWGSIEYLVHGIAFANREDLEGSFVETSRAGFQTALGVSSFSLLDVTHRMMPLLEKNGASIIALSYLAAERAVPSYNVMGTAKAALEQIVRQLAFELGPKNIRVNAISAGPVNTVSARGVRGFTGMIKEHAERASLKRNVTQQEVGSAGLFLLSDMSSGTTGEVLYVDAGYRILGV